MSCAYSCLRLIWPPPLTADRHASLEEAAGLCVFPRPGPIPAFGKSTTAQPNLLLLLSQLFTPGKPRGNGFPRVRWADGEEAPSPAPAAGAPLKSPFLGDTHMVHAFHTRLRQITLRVLDREKCLSTTLYIPLSPTFIPFHATQGPQDKTQEQVTRLKSPISTSLPTPLALHLGLNNLCINFPG